MNDNTAAGREGAIGVLARLVACPSISRNPNLELVDFSVERLKRLGFRVQVQQGSGDRANVFATLGPDDQPGLMLAGHSDVVPVEDQQWESDPFVLRRTDQEVVGRGVADMKGFLAQVLLAAESWGCMPLTRPVHLAFTYDEEVGCSGAAQLVEGMAQGQLPRPAYALIGEPTGYQVFRRHKGITLAKVVITGVEGHSSNPHRGVSAIWAAARLISWLEALAEQLRQQALDDPDLEAPYTTLNVGMVQGGQAYNIIPNRAEVMFEYRTPPGQDPQQVLQQVQAYVAQTLRPQLQGQDPRCNAVVVPVSQGLPMVTPAGGPLEVALLALTGQARAGAAPFFTEGALYNQAHIPSIICGPGEIHQAHRPNEALSIQRLEQGLPLLQQLVARLCTT